MASVQGSHRTGSAHGLLEPARQMRWRVPEVALVLSDRAVALARGSGDRSTRLRAEALALFAANRLGRGVAATGRALAALRDAESAGEADVLAELRVELAWCARGSGSNDVALRVLDPVLRLQRVDPELRAHALLALAASLPACTRGQERTDAIDEAERLYAGSDLGRDLARLLRARVCAARAGHHRRRGDFAAAVDAAGAGIALLGELGDPAADSGEVRASLALERGLALLELGRRDEAVQESAALLAQPVRAAAAGPVGWLSLAMATRVHAPEGAYATALRLLNDTVAVSERHRLDCLLAETANSLSQFLERSEEFSAALRALRTAYAADRRWRTEVQAARLRLLEAFPGVETRVTATPPPLVEQPAEPARSASPPAAEPEPELPAEPAPSVEHPVVAEPAVAEAEELLAGTGDVRDAARRLMETLTGRAAQARQQAMPEPREPEPPSTAPEPQAAPRQPSGPDADVTAVLPVLSLSEPPEDPPVDVWPSDDQAAEPAEPEEEPTGRRSRGRSLDEIRASLRLGEQSPSGRRRARRAEEADGTAPTPAAEVLARHLNGWAPRQEAVEEPPQGAVEEPPPESPAPPEPRESQQDDQPAVAADKIGLADLLTEALMAYETGRRGQNAEAPAGRHSEARASGPTGFSRSSRTTSPSTSDISGAARHRRPAMGSGPANPQL
ncbi:hypothetical protein [Saccharopolyspora rosea]|uniref:Tetratricopeptide repeat protein n=1 Tax=Saccharopolyspora rosea TaxID=524884 RepID=A0ABW3FY66_9PSEU|nr:hypothetical protein [Saccharopolyspora rosea]